MTRLVLSLLFINKYFIINDLYTINLINYTTSRSRVKINENIQYKIEIKIKCVRIICSINNIIYIQI